MHSQYGYRYCICCYFTSSARSDGSWTTRIIMADKHALRERREKNNTNTFGRDKRTRQVEIKYDTRTLMDVNDARGFRHVRVRADDTEDGYRKKAAPTRQPLVGWPKVNPTSCWLRGRRNILRIRFSDVSFWKIRFSGQRALFYPAGSQDRRVIDWLITGLNGGFGQIKVRLFRPFCRCSVIETDPDSLNTRFRRERGAKSKRDVVAACSLRNATYVSPLISTRLNITTGVRHYNVQKLSVYIYI